jgi:hypothetical protein
LRHIIQRRVELRIGRCELFFEAGALGNVQISAEHAKNLAIRIAQRHLAGQQRNALAVGRCLRLVYEELAAAALDDFAVVAAIDFRLLAPSHLVIVFADQVFRAGKSCVARERLVASQVDEILVLPKYPRRDRIENCSNDLLWIPVRRLRCLSALYRRDRLGAPHRHVSGGWPERGAAPMLPRTLFCNLLNRNLRHPSFSVRATLAAACEQSTETMIFCPKWTNNSFRYAT